MSILTQYIIFGDQSWPVESLAKALPRKADVSAFVEGRGWVLSSPLLKQSLKNGSLVKASASPAQAAALCPFVQSPSSEIEPVAIVGFQDPQRSQEVLETLRNRKLRVKILEVGSKETRPLFSKKKRVVAWSDLISGGVDTEIHLLTVQDRVRELREYLRDSEQIALLLQDDPDPDGLAGSLALRKVLGRNAQTAPIVSFGHITRPENVAMARLLEIEIQTILPEELEKFNKVVLVDCQPSFFKGRKINADVVLDHHPRCLAEDRARVKFEEIREDLGSISTLMTQYLRAAGVEVSQRLATALLYGIKSDTLMLNREVSEFDLEAFTFLYPRINNNTLRKIERPELPMGYLECLREGLSHLKVHKGIAVLPLGKVAREEWIPQAADFALQIEGADWALACGLCGDKLIISGRNCGYIQHGGELFKELFDEWGCAGGHRTMAKAIIQKSVWTKRFGEKALKSAGMAATLRRLVSEGLLRRLAAKESAGGACVMPVTITGQGSLDPVLPSPSRDEAQALLFKTGS